MTTAKQARVTPGQGDALIVVDVQNDFLPGGNLAVPRGDEVIAPLNRYLGAFRAARLPIFATRDWHPPNHCSFKPQGGPWPAHCVAHTAGAAFARELKLPPSVSVISKAATSDQEAYSGFAGTDLEQRLKTLGVKRVFIGGLATDYCVLQTVKDALAQGFEVCVLRDAMRAVNAHPHDGHKAEQEMMSLGAQPMNLDQLAA